MICFPRHFGESNGDAGDQYTGLNRFGWIVDQRWIKSNDVNNPLDRFQYGYDRNGNRLYKDNLLNNSFDELYHANGASNGYDPFNQLTDFRRGALSDTNSDNIPDTITTSSRTQGWSLDAMGNWSSVTTDGNTETRAHNALNETTSISGQTNPAFDNNGNMTTDQTGKTLIVDPWNHLVEVKNGSTTLVGYGVDALGRRIKETVDSEDYYYTAQWQVIEERVSGTAKIQYVWSPVYIDAMILRDRDADGNSGNGLEERLYVLEDANWNVSSLMNAAGSVQERFAYDPFGQATFLAPDWSTRSDSSFVWIYLHQGGRLEAIFGLYHFRNREYSATLGRWISADPIGFEAGDTNLYRAMFNRPLDLLDPFGLSTGLEEAIEIGTKLPPGWLIIGGKVVLVGGAGAIGVGGGYLVGCATTGPATDAACRWWYAEKLAECAKPRPFPRFRPRGPKTTRGDIPPCAQEFIDDIAECNKKYKNSPSKELQECYKRAVEKARDCFRRYGIDPNKVPPPVGPRPGEPPIKNPPDFVPDGKLLPLK